MVLFLVKILYVVVAVLFFPIDLLRNWLYHYMVKKEYERLQKEVSNMFDGVKIENIRKK